MSLGGNEPRGKYLTALQFHPLTLLARIRNLTSGALLTQATTTTITYNVFDLDSETPDTAVVSGTVTIASAIFDNLQLDDRWSLDDQGYNFAHTLANSTLAVPNHTYQLEYQFTPSNATSVFAVAYLIRVLEWRSGETMRIGDPVVNGSTGAVLFVDGSLNLAQDAANLSWNATSKRLTVNNTILLTNLATADPSVTGALWNDAGAAMLSGYTAPIHVSTGTILTDAQIKAIPSTGITVVAAQGLNTLIVPVAATVRIDATAGQYTGVTNASLSLMLGSQYASDHLRTETALGTGFNAKAYGVFPLPNSSVGSGTFGAAMAVPLQFSTSAINTALTVKDNYAGLANYGGGNAANTMKITVAYMKIDVS